MYVLNYLFSKIFSIPPFAVNKYKLTLNYKNKLKSNEEENNNKKIL